MSASIARRWHNSEIQLVALSAPKLINDVSNIRRALIPPMKPATATIAEILASKKGN